MSVSIFPSSLYLLSTGISAPPWRILTHYTNSNSSVFTFNLTSFCKHRHIFFYSGGPPWWSLNNHNSGISTLPRMIEYHLWAPLFRLPDQGIKTHGKSEGPSNSLRLLNRLGAPAGRQRSDVGMMQGATFSSGAFQTHMLCVCLWCRFLGLCGEREKTALRCTPPPVFLVLTSL